MFYIKNTLFNDLTKNQKSSLLSFLKSFTKKHLQKSAEEVLDLFIEDEIYYKEVGNPHFEWIIEEFEKDSFLKELKSYINECKKEIARKEAQKPFLEKQKALAKAQKKKIQESMMAKEEPTKKQLYYYEKLCKQYSLQKEETNGLSKLDLKNKIGKILDEQDKTKTDTRLPEQGFFEK